jgi:hypothetical protein
MPAAHSRQFDHSVTLLWNRDRVERGQLAHQQTRRITVLAHPPVPRPPGARRRPLAYCAFPDKVADVGQGQPGPSREEERHRDNHALAFEIQLARGSPIPERVYRKRLG